MHVKYENLEKILNMIYLRQSMAGDSFQDVDAVHCYGQWTSTVTLREAWRYLIGWILEK